MRFIFLDTNNWIHLSNGFNILSNKYDELHLKVFDIIERRTSDGSIVFLINDIVLEEWKRNKTTVESQIKNIRDKYNSYRKTLKAIKGFIQDEPKEFSMLESLLKKAYEEKLKKHKNHIKKVEKFLLEQTIKIPISDKCKIEATDLALLKKAPFIGDKKNSMADAVILLSSIEFINENHKHPLPEEVNGKDYFFPESFFVSSNKGDFSSPEQKEVIHPDLEPFLNKTNTEFYFTLRQLVDSLEERFLSDDEARFLEHIDERLFCKFCDSMNFPTVEFSEYFEVVDPNKEFIDEDQLALQFPGIDIETAAQDSLKSIMTKIRTAECTECGAEYMECTCGELTPIDEYNTTIECAAECGNMLIVHADIDRKGFIYQQGYEVIKAHRCNNCGHRVTSVNEAGLCEDCEEYDKIVNN
ncbi:PIN domain-containing protein [Fulvivirga ulvae]|uniref:PIN domain-containing protein n=1 Tax=Fulvivirga ulvae TaxID=2904245 RepID=UPI001F15C95E|nr:PIN domain-containing protein [Fulvivirga ulvae]UII32154.1 PIN domain-containing protein [Fulvivirga ulvae]